MKIEWNDVKGIKEESGGKNDDGRARKNNDKTM